MKRRKIMLGALLLMSGVAFSQVGVGIKEPHKSTLLHLVNKKDNYKGMFVPNVPLQSSKDASIINNGDILNSLLVYNTATVGDVTPGFYYWKVKEWVRVIDSKDILENLENFPRNKKMAVKTDKGIEVLYIEDTRGHIVSIPLKDINIVTTLEDKGKGEYVFTNEEGTETVINVPESVVTNITEILNDVTVKKEIFESVVSQGKEIKNIDQSITVSGGEKAVLNEVEITVTEKGITTNKIRPGNNKQILITNANGKVEWVDASDEVIKEVVKNNETVTVLQENHNGTFTYFNEDAIDNKTGKPIKTKGITFDANTLRIQEKKGEKEKGIYVFYDGLTSFEKPLMTISTRANSIYFDNSDNSVVDGDNVQQVIENIIKKIEIAQGKPADIKGEGILINGNPSLAGAVLKELLLTIGNGAITEEKIADQAVTTYKLRNESVTTDKIKPGTDKHILVTKQGKVAWVPATDEIIKEVVKQNETITVLDTSANDGTFIYYNEEGIDKDGKVIKGKGTSFDANTLTIADNGKGKYIFRDGKTQTGPALAEIDILGTVIENITEILENQNVKEQIFEVVALQGKKLDKGDNSILVEGGDKAVLVNAKISVAPKGITEDKIAPGKDKYILVTKGNEVKWVAANDEVIKEAVKTNETITVLDTSANNGTFIYYNEKAIDKDGKIIPGKGVPFSANTLVITQKNPGKGVYTFYDGVTSIDAPLMTIDVVTDVINNINAIVDSETVINAIYEKVAAKGKAATPADKSIVITSGDKAVLNEMQVAVAKDGIDTGKIAPQAVTTEKIAPGERKGQLLVTNGNGEVQWMDATDDILKEILNSKQAITYIEDSGKGTFTYYNEACFDKDGKRIESVPGVTFDANTLRIEEVIVDKKGTGVFKFYDKSDDKAIATIDVKASVINNIDEILGDTHVQNSIYTTVANKGKEIKSTDASLLIKGDAKEKAVLNDITIDINTDGVKNHHIKELAVTADKIGSGAAATGSILTSDGLGGTSFKTSTEAISPAMQGDLVGESGVIKIVDKDGKEGAGGNVLFGNKEVKVAIVDGGVKGKHIGYETIQTNNVANQTITATKLSSKGAEEGTVATAKKDGTVSYLPITAGSIAEKGNITTDDIVSVDNGTGKVLADVKLGINDKSVTAAKLSAEGVTSGTVATANADGTVTYQAVNASNIADKAALTTDGIIEITNGDGSASILKALDLKIKDKGINTGQLADSAVTNNQIANLAVTSTKISSEGAGGDKRVLVSGLNNETTWQSLPNLVATAAGNLTTDNIIEIVNGDGTKALFKDVALGIKDGSITNQKIKEQTIEIGKLSNVGSQPGMVMVTNANGGFTYVDRESIVQAGEDLTLGAGLEFTLGNGQSAVLADTGIKIKDKGITTTQLADGAVKVEQMSSLIGVDNADANTVLTADGTGKVAYKKINDAAFEGAAANLKSDGSLHVPTDNKAVLNELEIGIADFGVQTKHINDKAVIATKIGSEASLKGTVLAADGNGVATFQTLKEIAEAQGSSITSKEGSLRIAGNKATLENINVDVADKGIKNKHIDDKAVTADKIGSKDAGVGLVLTSTEGGGAAFKTLGDVLGQGGKTISGAPAISVVGGDKAALKDVTIDITNLGVTKEKLAAGAVTTSKILDDAVTTGKINPGKNNTLLGTDKGGTVKWMDSNDETIKVIFSANEKVTLLKDNGNGTFTYYNEKEVDSKGKPLTDAKGITFDANTLSIDATTPGIYVFNDKLNGGRTIATIDTRASNIIFEGDINTKYENVEAAIIDLITKIEKLENLEIEKAALSGDGILVNGVKSVADGVLKEMTLSIADEAVTPQKIKGGKAKQLLITNDGGKAQWVDGSNDIIKEIVQGNEKITLLEPKDNGTFIYYNESDIDKDGNKIGAGVLFNANTLTIDNPAEGRYIFKDKFNTDPLAIIDIKATVINNIKELLEEVNIQEQIFNIIANQGKKVSTDTAIHVEGGDKAALNAMTISLNDGGVTSEKVAKGAITEDKLFAGADKADYVPVVQANGSVKYQPMTMVVTGQMLNVDSSLEVTGEASRALLEELGLKVKTDGIGTAHIQGLAVTSDKISSSGANKGAVLMADGSGNTTFTETSDIVSSALQGDLVSDDSIVVDGGENVLFGDKETKVTLKINEGGVKGTHIAGETIENDNIANRTIQAGKLTAGVGVANRVALADDKGAVTYTPLSTQLLTNKGTIKVTDGISVDNGVDKVLADVTLGIKDTSITAGKLQGGNAPEGAVATVGSNGQTVTYQLPTFDHFANKGSITTDGVIIVNDGTDKVLADVTLGIKDQAIDTKHLANNAVKNAQIDQLAVTADKISSENVGEKRVMISQKDGTVQWGELKDIVTNTAGNLTTDNIIELVKGTGVNALLADTQIGIKDNSITKDKLSSKDIAGDQILVTDGTGGFIYAPKGGATVAGQDLNLGSALAFTNNTTGKSAMLIDTNIDVASGGINTVKLADGAVSKVKISAEGESANAVLTADGKGKVEYKKVNDALFEGKAANLSTDSSIKLTGGTAAVLATTSIVIAESGVENKHIKELAVTNDKISSKVGTTNAGNGTILTADGSGKTAFKGLSDIAKTQGKEVKSDNSLTITSGNKAALEDLTISVAKDGIRNKHINTREVTADKIGTPNTANGLVLTANGQGGAEFKSVTDAMSNSGKDMKSGAGINLSGGTKAALRDVTISVASKGIDNDKIADVAVDSRTIVDKAVTTSKIDDSAVTNAKIANGAVMNAKIGLVAVQEKNMDKLSVSTRTIRDKAVTDKKISSEGTTPGYVLTADNIGGAYWAKVEGGNTSVGDIETSSTIMAINGAKGSVMKDVELEIIAESIEEGHLAGKAVTRDKIANKAVDTEQLEDWAVIDKKVYSGDVAKGYVLTADGSRGAYWSKVEGGNTSVGDIETSSTIMATKGAKGSVMKDIELEIMGESIEEGHLAEKAVTQKKIADKAVGFDQLADNSVYNEKIHNYGIKSEKINSEDKNGNDTPEGYALTSDGDGGAYWAKVEGGSTSVGDIKTSSTIMATKGAKGSVMEDVVLEIMGESIEEGHLADKAVVDGKIDTNAVGYDQIKRDAVRGVVIQDRGVESSKIDSDDAEEGYVLTADGNGGASFQPAKGGGGNTDVAMPQVFYLPAIYVEIISGDDTSIELHDFYKEQYGSPMVVNSNAGKDGYSLHVYDRTELNYYVTYYDKKVFYDVRVDNDGELHYKVYSNVKPTARTFFNVVLQVR